MIKNWLLQKHSLFKYCTKRAYRIKNLHSWKLSGFTQPEQKQLSGIMKGTASKNDLFLSPTFSLSPPLLGLKQSVCPTISKALVKKGTVPFVTRLSAGPPPSFLWNVPFSVWKFFICLRGEPLHEEFVTVLETYIWVTSLLEPGDTVQCSAEVKNGLSLSFIYTGLIYFDFGTATLELELKFESGLLCSSRSCKKNNPNPINILLKMRAVTYSFLNWDKPESAGLSIFSFIFCWEVAVNPGTGRWLMVAYKKRIISRKVHEHLQMLQGRERKKKEKGGEKKKAK